MGRSIDRFTEESAVYKKKLEYMQEVAPKLYEAEKIVHSIKHTKEWTYTLNYFNILYHRGKLAVRPTYQNGYAIVPAKPEEVITLDRIEDILTPEQKELIMQRIKEG